MTNQIIEQQEEVDNVIRNPNRATGPAPEPYVPEYVRLGRYPVVQGIDTIDGEPVDGATDLNTHVIDNNEYVSFNFGTEYKDQSVSDTRNNSIPNVGEFILMVDGTIICYGNNEQIINEAKKLLYGEHSKFTKPVDMNNIILLKRVALKVGVFLDE